MSLQVHPNFPNHSTDFDEIWYTMGKAGRSTQSCVNLPVTVVLTIHRHIQPPIEPVMGKGEQKLSKI
jgi:hypothetical protein